MENTADTSNTEFIGKRCFVPGSNIYDLRQKILNYYKQKTFRITNYFLE